MNSAKKIETWFDLFRILVAVAVAYVIALIILAIISDDPEKIAIKDDLWEYLSEKDHELYLKLRRGIFGTAVHLPGRIGKRVVTTGYGIARNIFGFN